MVTISVGIDHRVRVPVVTQRVYAHSFTLPYYIYDSSLYTASTINTNDTLSIYVVRESYLYIYVTDSTPFYIIYLMRGACVRARPLLHRHSVI